MSDFQASYLVFDDEIASSFFGWPLSKAKFTSALSLGLSDGGNPVCHAQFAGDDHDVIEIDQKEGQSF